MPSKSWAPLFISLLKSINLSKTGTGPFFAAALKDLIRLYLKLRAVMTSPFSQVYPLLILKFH
jgi:hypothetical protein